MNFFASATVMDLQVPPEFQTIEVRRMPTLVLPHVLDVRVHSLPCEGAKFKSDLPGVVPVDLRMHQPVSCERG